MKNPIVKDQVRRYHSVYRGIVRDIRDPQNLRRIKVSVPQVTGPEITDWIWPMLSTKKPPAVGNGVWVFYIGGDPDYPVWIGDFGKPDVLEGMFSYGSWFSTQDQTTATANTAYTMTVNNTDYSSGISVKDTSKFTVDYDGTYNFQFSAQLHHITGGGGGAGTGMWIWIKKNGTNVSNSATRLNIQSGDYAVAAWNFVLKLKKNDYIQLAWSANTTDMTIEYESASSPYPAVPSLIVTMNQIA